MLINKNDWKVGVLRIRAMIEGSRRSGGHLGITPRDILTTELLTIEEAMNDGGTMRKMSDEEIPNIGNESKAPEDTATITTEPETTRAIDMKIHATGNEGASTIHGDLISMKAIGTTTEETT
mmetsp:Transcript_75372/g.147938  ORF Transcript_75372/g.147938 Transcript_75372/m.147938 type:complete len:122 (+) Transcript_75372:280-645(+)